MEASAFLLLLPWPQLIAQLAGLENHFLAHTSRQLAPPAAISTIAAHHSPPLLAKPGQLTSIGSLLAACCSGALLPELAA